MKKCWSHASTADAHSFLTGWQCICEGINAEYMASRVNEKKIAHSKGLMPSSKVRYEEDIKPKAISYKKPRESFAKILREARKAKGKASLPSTASHTKTQFMGRTGKSKFKPYYHLSLIHI
eukprot:TRINITY_DN2935_c0_g1_i1.p1 TRINITY_DN2935_c0_g1~~TRINITY_DN2935_c0_g1_i1.p1  ORF type:complete len:121 (-),score=14.60 TRINITY_DN2935_c0_g1_i1:119-481(-)